MSSRLPSIALFALSLLLPTTVRAAFPGTIPVPDGKGDQVVFYYDARDDFATFINLRNESTSDLSVRVLFYGPTFTAPFVRDETLPAGALKIFDTGALRSSGLAAQFGIAIATAVDATGRPLVTHALSGNFTVANLRTQAAWGAAGAARSAAQEPVPPAKTAPTPEAGTTIDGTTVALTPIQPASADLAAYYNPDTLAPVSDGGNQLIFVNFEDVPGTPFTAKLAATTWSVTAKRGTGDPIPPTTFVATGVTVSDLASVAGAGVNGASGSVSFVAAKDPASITRLVFFTESLGTFGTGYLLPRGKPPTTATPKPPKPTATPAPL